MNYKRILMLSLMMVPTMATLAMERSKVDELFIAIRSNDAPKVEALLQGTDHEALANSADKADIAALREAATAGKAEIVKSLIRAGANPNAPDSYNITPLMLAALGGHKDTAIMLIKLDADVNATDLSGQSALHYVQFGGRTTQAQKDELTKILKDAGAE